MRGLEITAVPFDPRFLFDSLALAAPTPRPEFPELEQRVLKYQPSPSGTDPDRADQGTMESAVASAATRDSVLRLSAALRRMDRTAPGYRESYNRFRDLYARYSARAAARENALRRLHAGDRSLAEQAARAADSLRAWERVAYRDFPRVAEGHATALGRAPQRVTTDSAGRATLGLPAGDWWLVARLADPDNPFVEYSWSILVSTAGLPFGIPVSLANAETRWRH
ncbi:MAG: hypothetical protein EXR93_06220 [Gemmatimonadetes bacterium]|nr:hypothetical protein [Gemmatimonadota bacterium]